MNVRVINNSWGGGGYSDALASAIQASSNADILFVAAAGNSGTNNDVSPQYPANYTAPNVISVAAIDQSDRLASFSCYGAATVDVAAPGVSIYSTVPGNKYAIYSGTSMATPFVSGTAALAWAMNPNATAAQVRQAILDGARPVASLSGKIASGGVLDAYNTLTLLDVPTSSGPVVGSLTASPGSVAAGAVVTLTAGGIADASNVVFALDVNNNGHYDAGDSALGSTSTIVNGQAAITINTSDFAVGDHRILAAAQDSASNWSPWISTMLTMQPADDHGNNAATATTVGASSSTAGAIEAGGDVDWFKFEAVAGKTYLVTVGLGTLRDSVLYLYDTNGAKQLAFNDDYGSGYASQISWTAPSSGVYYVAVAGYSSSYKGTYSLSLQSPNAAPVLAAIGNQSLPYGQTTLNVVLNASDADGDSLTYSAQAMTVDGLAQKAYSLDQRLGLHKYANGSYYLNARGAHEKYVLGNGNALYFILPNGSLYRWGGSIAKSTLVDTLSSAYYANPALLCSAQTPSLDVDQQRQRGGEHRGQHADDHSGGGLHWHVLRSGHCQRRLEIRHQEFHRRRSLAAEGIQFRSATRLAYLCKRELLPERSRAHEKYMLGNNNTLYFIVPNGTLYRWGGSIAKSTRVAAMSPAYYADPRLLHDAQSPSLSSFAAMSARVGR